MTFVFIYFFPSTLSLLKNCVLINMNVDRWQWSSCIWGRDGERRAVNSTRTVDSVEWEREEKKPSVDWRARSTSGALCVLLCSLLYVWIDFRVAQNTKHRLCNSNKKTSNPLWLNMQQQRRRLRSPGISNKGELLHDIDVEFISFDFPRQQRVVAAAVRRTTASSSDDST